MPEEGPMFDVERPVPVEPPPNPMAAMVVTGEMQIIRDGKVVTDEDNEESR
jgi:hypothetical protein